MPNTLYDWCEEKKNRHPELNFDCSVLGTKASSNDTFLMDMLTTSMQEKIKNSDNLTNEIAIKRRQVTDLENMITDKNYLTHERRLEELQKLEKKYYNRMVYMIIFLVVAILMGILLIYNFFFLKKK